MYSYVSENNFGSSNQILVPTGYNLLLRSRSDYCKVAVLRCETGLCIGSENLALYCRGDYCKVTVLHLI
jgi:hypothetical protein